MKKKIIKGLKGFTLIELSVVIATTTILMSGFTSFTYFFSKAYGREQEVNLKFNSALDLKNILSNNIDSFNYQFDSEDLKVDLNNTVDNNNLWIINNIVHDKETKKKVKQSRRIYFFKNVTNEDTKVTAKTFGFQENIKYFDKYTEEEIPEKEETIISNKYVCKSEMALTIKLDQTRSNNKPFKLYTFQIDFDYKEDEETKKMVPTDNIKFEKYIYFKK